MTVRPARLNITIATLFMVGSACFAVGATPAYASAVGTTPDLVTFVVGSVFFTLASFGQLVQAQSPELLPDAGRGDERGRVVLLAWRPHDRGWLAAAAQFPGTLAFNVTTSAALITGLTAAQEHHKVWRPDFVGSVLFLVASAFALAALGGADWHRWRPRDLAWSIAWINMTGSIFFMLSAIGSYVLPDTGGYINVAWANGGTLLGALCFFAGAALMPALWRRLTVGAGHEERPRT